MQITKVLKGPTYDTSLGWLVTIGEVEKVKGAMIGVSGGSCGLTPVIAGLSGNILQVVFQNAGASGALWAISSIMTGTDFMVVAEGY